MPNHDEFMDFMVTDEVHKLLNIESFIKDDLKDEFTDVSFTEPQMRLVSKLISRCLHHSILTILESYDLWLAEYDTE